MAVAQKEADGCMLAATQQSKRGIPAKMIATGAFILATATTLAGQSGIRQNSDLPRLLPIEAARLLREHPRGLEIRQRLVPAETLAVLEEAVAKGQHIFIYDSRVEGSVTFGSRYGVVQDAATLPAEIRAFLGNQQTVRVVFGQLYISTSVLERVEVNPRLSMQTSIPIVFQATPILLDSSLRTSNVLLSAIFASGQPLLKGLTSATSEGIRLNYSHCWLPHLRADALPANTEVTTFTQSHFAGSVYLNDFTFRRASFDAATFDAAAEFKGMVFEGQVSFAYAKFMKGVRFERTRFDDFVSFEAAVFPAVHFHQVTFVRGGTFTDAAFDENGMATFSDTASAAPLLGLEWERLRIPFERAYSKQETSAAAALLEKRRALMFLEENSRRLGLREQGFDLYRRRKAVEREAKPRAQALFEWLTLDLMSGYGTLPSRILGTSVLVIILFGMGYYPFLVRPKSKAASSFSETFWWRFWESLMFSGHTFMRVGYTGWEPSQSYLQMSVPTLNARRWAVTVAWTKPFAFPFGFHFLATIEGALGWCALALFTATLARVWID